MSWENSYFLVHLTSHHLNYKRLQHLSYESIHARRISFKKKKKTVFVINDVKFEMQTDVLVICFPSLTVFWSSICFIWIISESSADGYALILLYRKVNKYWEEDVIKEWHDASGSPAEAWVNHWEDWQPKDFTWSGFREQEGWRLCVT